MVEVNFGHRQPGSVIALRNVAELKGWWRDGDRMVIGSAVTYAEMEHPEFAALVPALAKASRTVGSPQIRNAGTIGGNLATGSPAGDSLPVLAALEADITVASSSGYRTIAFADLIVGPKRTVLGPNEVIVSVSVPVLDGPQEYLKIGTRNAMVIAVADVALVVDRGADSVRVAMGSVGPIILRARDAEAFAATQIDWAAGVIRTGESIDEIARSFGQRAGAEARPIDDHRSSAAYRRRGIEVLAQRALRRAFLAVGGESADHPAGDHR
jgi:CO/xanthine dehydrogenase FAD-binding subunit